MRIRNEKLNKRCPEKSVRKQISFWGHLFVMCYKTKAPWEGALCRLRAIVYPINLQSANGIGQKCLSCQGIKKKHLGKVLDFTVRWR